MAEQYANFGTQTLIAGLAGTSTATTWLVTTSAGYPATTPFHVTMDSEICLVTASTMASGTFTMSGTRGAESTTVTTHSSGITCLHALTSGAMDQIIADNVTLTTYANRAASAKAGRVQLYNDMPNMARDNGATFDSFGPIFPLTDPTGVSFSWRNQGSATESTIGKSLYLLAPAVSGNNMKGREIAQPARPYSITICIIPHQYNVASNSCGMYITDGTKLSCLTIQQNSQLNCGHFTDVNTFNANPFSQNWAPVGPTFLKMQDTGTNLVYSWSSNGVNFHQVLSEGRTSFMAAPTNVGYFANSANSTLPSGVTLLSWLQGT